MSCSQRFSRLETSESRSDLKLIAGYFAANGVRGTTTVTAKDKTDEYHSNSDDDDDNESYNMDVADEQIYSSCALNVAPVSLKKKSGMIASCLFCASM